jgi:hypothetical protein
MLPWDLLRGNEFESFKQMKPNYQRREGRNKIILLRWYLEKILDTIIEIVFIDSNNEKMLKVWFQAI